jgi:hypothetical protein
VTSSHERNQRDEIDERGQEEPVPENPQGRPAETVEALEARTRGAVTPDQGGTVPGEDVSENPSDEGMEDLPGPPGHAQQESSG